MSIQSLINIAETLEIDRRKQVSQQLSRSGIVKVTESVSRQPWRMTAMISAVLRYADAREVMESIDQYDRVSYQDVDFTNFSWMWKYRGDLTTNQLASLTVSSFVGNQLTLSVTGVTGSASQYIFKKNDIFTFGSSPYPFTVVTDVQRGSGSTVVVTTHRPNFTVTSLVGAGLTVGPTVKFRMIARSMPTYRVIPGPYVEFTGPLELIEFTGEVA